MYILGHVCVTTVAVEKAISVTYFECVRRLSNPAQKVHVLLLYCYLWSVWLNHIFSHISYRVRFLENLLNVKCVFWFSLQLLSTTLPTVRRTELNTVTNEQMSSHKIPIIILVRLEWNSNFLNQFLKKYTQIWNFMKACQVAVNLFHADRWTWWH